MTNLPVTICSLSRQRLNQIFHAYNTTMSFIGSTWALHYRNHWRLPQRTVCFQDWISNPQALCLPCRCTCAWPFSPCISRKILSRAIAGDQTDPAMRDLIRDEIRSRNCRDTEPTSSAPVIARDISTTAVARRSLRPRVNGVESRRRAVLDFCNTIGGEADIWRWLPANVLDATDPGCVKTHLVI